MRKLKLLPFFLLFLSNSGFATGDSLHYLTPKDTIFLSLGNYEEKIFEHVLEKKQTLFSLARFYGMKVADLYFYNPELKDGSYDVGQKVKIVIPNRAIIRYKPANYTPFDYVPVCYVVKQGDTFYSIAKRYFKLPLNYLAARNQMENTALKPNQKVQVGWMSIYGIPDSLRQFRGGPLWKKSYQLRQAYEEKSFQKKERLEKGAAFWNREKKGGSDLYALHRRAPVNSTISVSNPMSGRTVFVKVVGRIPNRAYGNEVKVVVSPAVAKMLGAKDPRFFVEVKYLK